MEGALQVCTVSQGATEACTQELLPTRGPRGPHMAHLYRPNQSIMVPQVGRCGLLLMPRAHRRIPQHGHNTFVLLLPSLFFIISDFANGEGALSQWQDGPAILIKR